MRIDLRRFTALSVPTCLVGAVLLVAPVMAQEQGATAPAGAQAQGVLARVDGVAITEADVALAVKDFAPELKELAPEQKKAVVERLIDTHLIARAAEADKLNESEDYKRSLTYLQNKALTEVYLARQTDKPVSDEEVKKLYDETVKTMKPEEEVRARHILFRAEDEAGFAEAEKKAIEAAKKAKEGADFAALAKELSEDPGSKENGGDLGYFGKEQMVPEFADTAFKLEKGAVSDPVKTQFGWHVIKTEDKRTQPLPTVEQVRPQIEVYLKRKAQADAIEALRKTAKIEIVEAPAEKPAPGAVPAPEAKKN
jgi:peptidyl-prolyl cis-trans isomerase C